MCVEEFELAFGETGSVLGFHTEGSISTFVTERVRSIVVELINLFQNWHDLLGLPCRQSSRCGQSGRNHDQR